MNTASQLSLQRMTGNGRILAHICSETRDQWIRYCALDVQALCELHGGLETLLKQEVWITVGSGASLRVLSLLDFYNEMWTLAGSSIKLDDAKYVTARYEALIQPREDISHWSKFSIRFPQRLCTLRTALSLSLELSVLPVYGSV